MPENEYRAVCDLKISCGWKSDWCTSDTARILARRHRHTSGIQKRGDVTLKMVEV